MDPASARRANGEVYAGKNSAICWGAYCRRRQRFWRKIAQLRPSRCRRRYGCNEALHSERMGDVGLTFCDAIGTARARSGGCSESLDNVCVSSRSACCEARFHATGIDSFQRGPVAHEHWRRGRYFQGQYLGGATLVLLDHVSREWAK